MFLIIFAIAIAIWILIFFRRLSTSDRPLPYLCYILGSSGYFLMFLTEDESSRDGSALTIFLLYGFIATFGLISLIFDSESVYKVLEMRDAEIRTRHKVILGFSAVIFIGIPWAIVLGLFGPH